MWQERGLSVFIVKTFQGKVGDLDLYFQKKSPKNKTLDVHNGGGDGSRRFGRSGFGGVVGAGVGDCEGQRGNCWGDVIVLQFESLGLEIE